MWPLSWLELAVLWDVPILVTDFMSEDTTSPFFEAFVLPLPQKCFLRVQMRF